MLKDRVVSISLSNDEVDLLTQDALEQGFPSVGSFLRYMIRDLVQTGDTGDTLAREWYEAAFADFTPRCLPAWLVHTGAVVEFYEALDRWEDLQEGGEDDADARKILERARQDFTRETGEPLSFVGMVTEAERVRYILTESGRTDL